MGVHPTKHTQPEPSCRPHAAKPGESQEGGGARSRARLLPPPPAACLLGELCRLLPAAVPCDHAPSAKGGGAGSACSDRGGGGASQGAGPAGGWTAVCAAVRPTAARCSVSWTSTDLRDPIRAWGHEGMRAAPSQARDAMWMFVCGCVCVGCGGRRECLQGVGGRLRVCV